MMTQLSRRAIPSRSVSLLYLDLLMQVRGLRVTYTSAPTTLQHALEDGTSLQKRDLFVICEGRRIGFQLDLSVGIEVHAILGKEFEVEIGKIGNESSSLQDKNENPMDPLQGNIKFTKRYKNDIEIDVIGNMSYVGLKLKVNLN